MALCFLTDPISAARILYGGNTITWVDGNRISVNRPSIELAAFPNVDFLFEHAGTGFHHKAAVYAVSDGKKEELFSSWQIARIYFCDVTGDGKPNLCTSIVTYYPNESASSGVLVYDYQNREQHFIADQGNVLRYNLSLNDHVLYIHKYKYIPERTSEKQPFTKEILFTERQVITND